jgi:competence protein ComEA
MFVITLFTAMLAVQAGAQTDGAAPARAGRGSSKSQNKAAVMVNLNTATAAELTELPGVGPKTAARIVEYRQKKGPFKKPEELMNVQGVGEKSFLRLKSQITVGGKSEPPAQQD